MHKNVTVFIKQQDQEAHSDILLSYIRTCVENVTVTKQIQVFPNRIPGITSEVQALITIRDSSFRSDDSNLFSTARISLRKGIHQAKRDYRKKI